MSSLNKKRAALYRRVDSRSIIPEKTAPERCKGTEADAAELYGYELSERYLDMCEEGVPLMERTGFLELLKDAEVHAFDLVVCDSVKQVSNNAKEWLLAVQELRKLGVGMYFARERIDTGSASGVHILDVLAALAEEGSEVTKTGKDGINEKDKAWSLIPGYESGLDGIWRIQEPYAETVREIYYRFLGGECIQKIANALGNSGMLTFEDGKWREYLVRCILRDERYAGNAFIRKWEDSGEYMEYYLVGKHEEIIPMQQWIQVQKMHVD